MEPSYISASGYQFRLALQGISPLIWRRLHMRSNMFLATLHAALHIVFAWSDETCITSVPTRPGRSVPWPCCCQNR